MDAKEYQCPKCGSYGGMFWSGEPYIDCSICWASFHYHELDKCHISWLRREQAAWSPKTEPGWQPREE